MHKTLKHIWTKLGIPVDYARIRRLPLQREAKSLVYIGRNPDGRILKLTPKAAQAWNKMRSTAEADGVILIPLSGYRSIARQTKIIRSKLTGGVEITDILKFLAAPGCSEHHTGRALDLGSPQAKSLNEDFARTAEYRWLQKHAEEFGFHLSYPRSNSHGIGYEPWHWCWRAVNLETRRL